MIKCENCIFYNNDYEKENGILSPTCNLKEILEKRKPLKKQDYSNILILNEYDSCKYHKYLSEIVEFVINQVDNNE